MAGESATLVYEETEHGREWRLFTLFEPGVSDDRRGRRHQTRRRPDLNLDGTDVRVTLVDQSRVYHIEGQAPEGVELGDVADYFNAEGGNNMVVVSWTGEEVECYRGHGSFRGSRHVGLQPSRPKRTEPFISSAELLHIVKGHENSRHSFCGRRHSLSLLCHFSAP